MRGKRDAAEQPSAVDEHDGLAQPDPESAARTICLRALEHAPRTRAELAATLARKGVPLDVAETVLDRFTEVGLIDDTAFAAAWVTSRHNGKGLARQALRHELRRRGVHDETVDEAVTAIDVDTELATAKALVSRKLAASRGLAADTRTRRLVGMLARKGYPAGLAFQVVREALREESAEASSE